MSTQCIPPNKICTYCSMNQQYMKGIQKREKGLLEISGS